MRCDWCGNDPLLQAYHDQEWGEPLFDDRKLFEFLILEGAQAGLSWITVLRKRENYREAFLQFDPEKIASFDSDKVEQLMQNPGIIRNRLKIESSIINAKAYLNLMAQQRFSDYLWDFVAGKPIKGHWNSMAELPSRTVISDQLSKDLKQRGFKFVGSTICYAFMQAVGMVNDHLSSCYKYMK
ncbi:MAG: DNA-3-methyladenine glycosylase [Gammaproteobacteria bacterium]|jgi:DNA-3-methyladenine glycosylase I|nr:DNA-3-methyladenine glycosylase [Gammaproteobacteria bacterium]